MHHWVSKSDHLQEVKGHKIWDLSRPVGPERQSGSKWLPEYGAYECWNHRVALQPPPLSPQEVSQPTAPLLDQVQHAVLNLHLHPRH